MKKRLVCLLTVLLMCFYTGCGAPVAQNKDGMSFTDDMGRQVIIEKTPERVAVLIGSFADVWCLAGGRDSIVAAADDTWTQFELGLKEGTARLGGVKTPNMEALLASEPELVIASARTPADVELEPVLNDMGIPVLYFNVSSFDDYLRMLDICTQITGERENYELYGTAVRAQIDRAAEKINGEAPRVLYVRASGSSCKVKNSEGTVLGEMLKDLGCVNVADSETGLLENLSMERIIAADPDYIFAVLQGSDSSRAEKSLRDALTSDPAWEGLSAVREGRFIILNNKLYNLKPNARWGEAYEKLAEILYGK